MDLKQKAFPQIILVGGALALVLQATYTTLAVLLPLFSTTAPELPDLKSAELHENHLLRRSQEAAVVYESAEDVVWKTYNETYRIFLESCQDLRVEERICFKMLLQRRKAMAAAVQDTPSDTNTTSTAPTTKLPTKFKPFPWWFQSLLRDSQGSGLHGGWHNFSATNPNVRMCSIEKIASTQWRTVFSLLNGERFMVFRPKPEEPQAPYDTPRFVFLRDPLERFLSAYINKCVPKKRRQAERHCEPNLVFNNPGSGMLTDLHYDKKIMFEAYVDAIPLKWNVHFFPQALYCDGLFRHFHEYKFVGNMGPTFYRDLEAVGKMYGGRFEETIERVFSVKSHVEREDVFLGVQTAAPKHVEEYYTARSVRRVLQYLSVDYITLGLPIPEWADRLLKEGR